MQTTKGFPGEEFFAFDQTDGRHYEAGEGSPMTPNTSLAANKVAPSKWGAFSHPAFTVIWSASLISYVGTAMFDTASGWLITNLNPSPLAVSLIQAAVSLPLFLFTVPAGALADIVDSRRLLIFVEVFLIFVSAILAVLVSAGQVTTAALLIATFLLGVAGAVSSPAWQAITPLQVPRQDLDSAISANSVGYNLSRAIGPALGGSVVAAGGASVPFWVYCFSNIGVLAALLWWRLPKKATESLPAERLSSAIRMGIRYTLNNDYMTATLVRTLAFFPFGCAYWALLPLIARSQTGQGPQFYGVLLGAIGVGAVGGTFAQKALNRAGPDLAVALGTLATAVTLVLFGLSHGAYTAIAACLIGGASWTVVLTNLYVSAQMDLPDWVRGRGLAIFLTIIFGATTVGSVAWGELAQLRGLPSANFVAAAGVLAAATLTWRWKLSPGAALDLTPALHWQAPPVSFKVDEKAGPVLVTVEYRVRDDNRAAFVGGLDALRHTRMRDGAFAWGAYQDTKNVECIVETFLIESWLELQHSGERITKSDELQQEHIRPWLNEDPKVTFMISVPRPHRHHARARKWDGQPSRDPSA